MGLVDVNLREMVWGISCLSLEVCISPSVLFSDHFLFLVPFSSAPFKPPGSIEFFPTGLELGRFPKTSLIGL